MWDWCIGIHWGEHWIVNRGCVISCTVPCTAAQLIMITREEGRQEGGVGKGLCSPNFLNFTGFLKLIFAWMNPPLCHFNICLLLNSWHGKFDRLELEFDVINSVIRNILLAVFGLLEKGEDYYKVVNVRIVLKYMSHSKLRHVADKHSKELIQIEDIKAQNISKETEKHKEVLEILEKDQFKCFNCKKLSSKADA